MPAFFSRQRGMVHRVTGQQGSAPMPFQIKLDGMDISSGNASARAIITQAGLGQEGSYQFLNTVGETIYAYIFGDRMGELVVSGTAFSALCAGGAETGIQQVLAEYEKHKISVLGQPVLVNFGDVPFKAFLCRMRAEINDAETHIGQWSFHFQTFPGRP
jgi:hypothetical protein